MEDAIILAASAVISGLMCLSDRVWYIQERTMLEMCWSKDSVWSSLTPSQATSQLRKNVLKNQQWWYREYRQWLIDAAVFRREPPQSGFESEIEPSYVTSSTFNVLSSAWLCCIITVHVLLHFSNTINKNVLSHNNANVAKYTLNWCN